MDIVQSSSFWGNHQEQSFGQVCVEKINQEDNNSKEIASPANFAPLKKIIVWGEKIRLTSLKSNTMSYNMKLKCRYQKNLF